jgi:hypothetical protein
MILKQVQLQNSREPLQIPYPPDFKGEKYAEQDSEEQEFYLSSEPRFLTKDEIEVAQEYLKTIWYSPKLSFTGCVMIDPEDPLLDFNHDQLDRIEKEQNLPSSRKHPTGGTRQMFERVLLIRERGYEGTGFKSLPAGVK